MISSLIITSNSHSKILASLISGLKPRVERKVEGDDLIHICAIQILFALSFQSLLKALKIFKMQTDIIRPTPLPQLDESDEEALDLFNNLNPNPESSPQHNSHHIEESEAEESRPLGRLTKLKKDSKKEKRKLKKKQKKLRKMQRKVKEMEEGVLKIVTPLKKSKKNKKNKQHDGSGSEAAMSHGAGSSQFSSESENKQDLQDELLNLNPDAAKEEQGSSPRKRLKRSGRKMKIEEKQGFRVEQLGNDPQVNLQKLERKFEDEDYSFDDVNKKTKKKRKPKVNVPTNQQIMNSFKEKVGVVESDGEEKEGTYDNGLDMLYAMKDKRKGGIKINNKFFCDIEIDPKDDEAPMPTPETLELELKPKSSHSSSCFAFLNRVETLKKQRGLENNADLEDFERRRQQRAKQSMAKVVTSMSSQDFHDDIELEVRVPTIARGKSADIINNTVFLKSFASKRESPAESPAQLVPTKSCGSVGAKREGLTRMEFYKQIKEQTRMRRSKHISEEQLKESFKKTNLGELEEARKRNQQKRRKEALSEEEGEEEDGDWNSEENKIEELLEKEERICGDIQQEEEENEQQEGENIPPNQTLPNPMEKQAEAKGSGENKMEEVEFSINLKEEKPINQQPQQELQEESQEINEENEIIDQLASASEQHQHQAEEQEMEESLAQPELEAQEQSEEQASVQAEPMEEENIVIEPNQEELKQQMELEEEGIMLRKRKMPEPPKKKTETQYPSPQPQQPQQPLHMPLQDKQNIINLPNTNHPLSQKPSGVRLAEEQAEEFRNFKKLRKFAMVIAEKKRIREQGRRYAAEFIEQQAQEGSDNEQHDDLIKQIDYAAQEKEYEGVDLDADLVELIDNAVDLNEEDEHEAFRKYLEDIRIKDREEIRKIIRGQFRTRQEEDELDVDEDERRRLERMEEVMKWMKQREEEDGQGIYLQPEEEEEHGSDSDSEYLERKRKKEQEKEEEAEVQRIPEAEEKAMIERFIENTLPCTKRDYRLTKTFDLGSLPESVKLDKGTNKTIGLSRLGSKNSDSQPTKLKKTSSLVNEIMSRTSISKITQKSLSSKLGRK